MSVKLILADYSKYSFVVCGDGTKLHKETFKKFGGKWNRNLTLNGGSIQGWVFSLKNKDEVLTYLQGSKEAVNLPFAKVVEAVDVSHAKIVEEFTAFGTATKKFSDELMSRPKVEMCDNSTQTEPEDIAVLEPAQESVLEAPVESFLDDPVTRNLLNDFSNLLMKEAALPVPKLDNTYFSCDCGMKVLRKNRTRHTNSESCKRILAEKK